jgi:hypothetical protein
MLYDTVKLQLTLTTMRVQQCHRSKLISMMHKDFFDFTLFLGVPRGIFPEKMSPVVEKRVPQQPIDACGLNNCMSRARHFFLNSNEKIFLTSPSF